MKKGFISLVVLLFVVLLSTSVLADSITIMRQEFGSSIRTYYDGQWSTHGYFDLTNRIPAGSTIKWVWACWDVGYSYSYSGVHVRIVDELGQYDVLANDQIDTGFAGKPANQEFYLEFTVDYMSWEGIPFYLYPSITIEYE